MYPLQHLGEDGGQDLLFEPLAQQRASSVAGRVHDPVRQSQRTHPGDRGGECGQRDPERGVEIPANASSSAVVPSDAGIA
jgi:hypothetical protein